MMNIREVEDIRDGWTSIGFLRFAVKDSPSKSEGCQTELIRRRPHNRVRLTVSPIHQQSEHRLASY